MSEHLLLQISGIIVLGILAQWGAWRLRVPSIVLLLLAGFVAGPLLGKVNPDELFGKMLLPVVSLSVGVILYEGGLSLRFRELREQQIFGVFCRITSITVLASWGISAAAAHWVAGLSWPVSTVFGAILVVTGPTVIGPILRHLRLRGRVGSLLKWEGIVVDPLGAILAVLVFSVVGHQGGGFGGAMLGFVLTLGVGIGIGLAAAAVLVVALRRYWIPDSLDNAVSLMLMVAAFVGANHVQAEAGLLAATVMGIALANQRWVSIRHIIEFKETVTVLLISCLFVILSARLRLEDLRGLGWHSLAFVGIMILVARPLSIFAATAGSSLPWRERIFLACMAPRGIVAAAVASVFALEFTIAGAPGAKDLVPLTFLLVFLTVLIYGLSSRPLARRLGLVHANPQGILFVGAHSWARSLAQAVQGEGLPVLMIDTQWENVSQARLAGLPAHHGSALAESTREAINLTGLGRLLALTSSDEVNALACLRYREELGRQEVYQLPSPPVKKGGGSDLAHEHRGRFLFGADCSFAALSVAFGTDAKVHKTRLSAQFPYAAFRERHGDGAIVLFVLTPAGVLQVNTVDKPVAPQPGDLVFSLHRGAPVPPPAAATAPAQAPA